MYTIYILYSFSHKKIYTGCTANLVQRFYSHNIYSNTDWTRSYRPWVVVYCEIVETKTEALKREKMLKSGEGRDWINDNLQDWISAFA